MAEVVVKIKFTKEQVSFLETWAYEQWESGGEHYYNIGYNWFMATEDPLVFYVLKENEVKDSVLVHRKELNEGYSLSRPSYKLYGHLMIPEHHVNQGFYTPKTLEGRDLSAGYGYVVSDETTITPMYIHNNIMRETDPHHGPCVPGVYKLWRKDGSV